MEFNELVYDYIKSYVYMHGRAYTNEDLDDVIHDLYLKFLSMGVELDASKNPRAYVFRFCRCRLIDMYKHRIAVSKHLEEQRCADLSESQSYRYESSSYYMSSDLIVDDFLSKLTSIQRNIVRLLMEGLTLAEIGERYGVTGQSIHRVVLGVREAWQNYVKSA